MGLRHNAHMLVLRPLVRVAGADVCSRQSKYQPPFFGLFVRVLSIELARPDLCLCVRCRCARGAAAFAFARAACGAPPAIAGPPTDLFDDLLRGLAGLGLLGLKHFGELAVTPDRHGQNEFKRLLTR